MKDKVRIKSFAKGLTLQLDDQIPFEELKEEVSAKFREARSFFGKETVALSFQGRNLSDEEELQLWETVQNECDLKILCLVEKNEEREKTFVKAMRLTEFRKMVEMDLDGEVQVFHGSLTDGEELDTPNSIVVFGDVESGCKIVSERSILILGTLYGSAHAGCKGDKKAIVSALEMMPENLSIASFTFEQEKKTKWGKKNKPKPQTAKVFGEIVILTDLEKEQLKDF
ncbi:MAG: septum site-determining protein MinC [Lachnospiraceae bacterium]|jgi:septum site-determining protein MinC|nr:septum site-determining protein MinC [Lachnospiraceae bacterium]MBQ2099932.1 septum site-determining protein MinC [Lachnospiraceae bacterium]